MNGSGPTVPPTTWPPVKVRTFWEYPVSADVVTTVPTRTVAHNQEVH